MPNDQIAGVPVNVYHREYYRRNKDRILQQRRHKYKTDEQYRTAIKSKALVRSKLRNLTLSPRSPIIEVEGVPELSFSLHQASRYIGRTYLSLIYLVEAGCIPDPFKTTTCGWYTESQITLLRLVFENIKAIPTFKEMREFLSKYWNRHITKEVVREIKRDCHSKTQESRRKNEG